MEGKTCYKHVSLSMMSEYEQVWIQDLGSNIFGKKGWGVGAEE